MPDILHLPTLFQISERCNGNPVQQICRPSKSVQGTLASWNAGTTKGHIFTPEDTSYPHPQFVVLTKSSKNSQLPAHILVAPNGPPTTSEIMRQSRWMLPSPEKPIDATAWDRTLKTVTDSWKGSFQFKPENQADGTSDGLRSPQIGALHAILAHWTISYEPATVVMPTGTGKTETMLAVLVAQQLKKVLVIVPTNALREQVGDKFLTLGILKNLGVISQSALYPVVGKLLKRPRTPEEAEAYFRRCNVVVTTAAILGQCSDETNRRISEICTHLIVDEAHHVAALTWDRVRSFFTGKPVLQFTATPYRGDGKLVGGKIIYNYPLRKAQTEGYFRPIRFKSVSEYNEEIADRRIAESALAQLEEDLKNGHDHLLMARCDSIEKATRILDLYRNLAPKYAPVIAHSRQNTRENEAVIRMLRNRTSRIVVCVSMFGEGFDLPQLKIAALHDLHKGLAITLQFTGRFTRTSPNVGDATVVANVADVDVEESLQELYGDDPDWNYVLRELSERAAGRQIVRSEFIRGFVESPDHIPLQNVFPKMSTVVYATHCTNWFPAMASNVLKNVYDKPALHQERRVAILVTKEFEPVSWGDVRAISNVVFDLYLVHWDKDRQLLYIHSSNNDSTHEGLAKAVCGSDVALIRGEQVFRVLHQVNRLILMNLGLGHSLSKAIRFTMHVGSDIHEGLAQVHTLNKFKTNLFGRGFERGGRASIGCSRKGRVWSYHVAADIGEWIDWCHHIGEKLLNSSIDVAAVLRGAMIPTPITVRPDKIPVTVEWSDDLLDRDDESVYLTLQKLSVPLSEISITLLDHSNSGPIRFKIHANVWGDLSPVYSVLFNAEKMSYVVDGEAGLSITTGRRSRLLSDYFQEEPPVIRFHDGSFLIYNDLFTLSRGRQCVYDRSKIEVWDWAGVDITKESQDEIKRADSIQRCVIEHLMAHSGDERFNIIFDDDQSGEAADVIAIRAIDERMLFRLYHCKYSKGKEKGSRVDDLYAVCGQAQSSVHWREHPELLLDHIIHREKIRKARSSVSRFEVGDLKLVTEFKRRLRTHKPEFEIFIVQPGLSAAQAGADHLELLAATELHLKETYNVPLVVVADS